MASFADKIREEIASKKAEIAVLEQHLAAGESWLQAEASAIWAKVRGWFSHPASTATVPTDPAPPSNPPAT